MTEPSRVGIEFAIFGTLLGCVAKLVSGQPLEVQLPYNKVNSTSNKG